MDPKIITAVKHCTNRFFNPIAGTVCTDDEILSRLDFGMYCGSSCRQFGFEFWTGRGRGKSASLSFENRPDKDIVLSGKDLINHIRAAFDILDADSGQARLF